MWEGAFIRLKRLFEAGHQQSLDAGQCVSMKNAVPLSINIESRVKRFHDGARTTILDGNIVVESRKGHGTRSMGQATH